MKVLFKNIFFAFIPLFVLFNVIYTHNTFADDIPLQMFVREDCSHCSDQKEYFSHTNIPIRLIDIKASEENNELFQTFTNAFELPKNTPITLAGNQIFLGYTNKHTGDLISTAYENAQTKYTVEQALENTNSITKAGEASTCGDSDEDCAVPKNALLQFIDIPFLGTFDLRESSRTTISLTLGFLDGFNPCAMWVLVIFLITLVQIGDRVKMAFVAGTFLLAEAVMYGLILVAWWQFFDFVGYESIIKPIVGAVAIGGGIFFLYEGFFTDGTCQVTNMNQRKKISDRIASIAKNPLSIATFFAILGLAFSVNIIEFACSAGYPQLFTNIMSSADVQMGEKITMLLLYLGAYMVDDLIVFAIALISIEKLGITHKYAKYTNIIGGVLMLLLGTIMIFAPEFLML